MSGPGHAASIAARPPIEVMSPPAAEIDLNEVRSFERAAASRAGSRPLMNTWTPSAASAHAQAKPKPALDAHTSAVRPAIPRSIPSILFRQGVKNIVQTAETLIEDSAS